MPVNHVPFRHFARRHAHCYAAPAQPRSENARIIAADSGMMHAAATLGLEAELWVGDFDSTSDALGRSLSARSSVTSPPCRQGGDRWRDRYRGGDCARRPRLHSRRRFRRPGRPHVSAMRDSCLRSRCAAIGALLTSGTEEAYPLLPGNHHLDLPAGSRLSIVPFCRSQRPRS